jgi:hypothetical protein
MRVITQYPIIYHICLYVLKYVAQPNTTCTLYQHKREKLGKIYRCYLVRIVIT